MRAKVPPLKTEDFCGPCNKPRCEICTHITKAHEFEWSSTKRIYSIRTQNWIALLRMYFTFLLVKPAISNTQEALKNFEVDLIITDVRIGTFWGITKSNKSFHAHFAKDLHQGESNWEVRLIDQRVSVDDARRREYYWKHELDTFQPNGLNEREVAFFLTQL